MNITFQIEIELYCVSFIPSPATRHPPPATRHPPPATRHPSPATRYPSPATRGKVLPSPHHLCLAFSSLCNDRRDERSKRFGGGGREGKRAGTEKKKSLLPCIFPFIFVLSSQKFLFIISSPLVSLNQKRFPYPLRFILKHPTQNTAIDQWITIFHNLNHRS